MRIARAVAFMFTVACLVVAAVSLLGSTGGTFTAGSQSTGWDCGSAAFPKTLDDFDDPDDAANCAGRAPASVALYSIALAGVGLGAVAITSRAAPTRRESEQP
jgi:hypothetical protein